MQSRILHASMFALLPSGGWGLPILLESPPGKGKTAIVTQYAARCGVPFMRLSPGLHGEGAFGVVPVPEGGVLTFPPHQWTRPFVATGRGIVLVDEVTTADRALQPPMLALLDSKAIGGVILPPGVRVLGACNAPDDAANGTDLAAALANRFGWFSWETTAADHIAYSLALAARVTARATGATPDASTLDAPIDCVAEEARVLAAWPDAFTWATGLKIGFLAAHPDYLYRKPPSTDPAASRAWTSDRTWDLACSWLAASRVHGLTDGERDEGIAAFLGSYTSEAWGGYLDGSAQNPAAADVLDERVAWSPDRAKVDAASALLASCLTLILPTAAPRRVERAIVMWRIVEAVDAACRDAIVPIVLTLIKARLHASDPALVRASKRTLALLNKLIKVEGAAELGAVS